MNWVETLPKSELLVVSIAATAVLDNPTKGLSVGVLSLDTDCDNSLLSKGFRLIQIFYAFFQLLIFLLLSLSVLYMFLMQIL